MEIRRVIPGCWLSVGVFSTTPSGRTLRWAIAHLRQQPGWQRAWDVGRRESLRSSRLLGKIPDSSMCESIVTGKQLS